MAAPFTQQLLSLPATVPFVGPETISRERGVAFRARLGANESAFGLSPKARKAFENANPSYYGDPTNFDLREKLSQVHGLSPERILVGPGIDGLFLILSHAFVEPETPVVTSQGTYPTFDYFMTRRGAKVHKVPYRDFKADLEALAEKATATKAPLVYLANPDNPTGTFHDRRTLESFLAKTSKDCVPVLDEAYADFAPSSELVDSAAAAGAIRLRTFSKAHGMAGLRIGYLIASEEIVAGLNRIRAQFEVSRPAQEAALASLQDPGFIESVIAEVAKGRIEYETLGAELGLRVLPSRTNFVSYDLEDPDRVKAVILALEKEGVFVRTGPAPNDRLLRVTVGAPEQRALFATALTSVLARI